MPAAPRLVRSGQFTLRKLFVVMTAIAVLHEVGRFLFLLESPFIVGLFSVCYGGMISTILYAACCVLGAILAASLERPERVQPYLAGLAAVAWLATVIFINRRWPPIAMICCGVACVLMSYAWRFLQEDNRARPDPGKTLSGLRAAKREIFARTHPR